MQQLEAHEVPLHKIFSSDYAFAIPAYQRPYAWEVEQASQLLEDLVESLDRDTDEPYFLGSIVLVKTKGESFSEVIDGQQRLTTLAIMFAVLRDLSDDAEVRTILDGMLIEPGNKIQKLEPKPRLSLRPKDQPFFDQYVQRSGATTELLSLKVDALATDAQEAIQSNTAALREQLEGWSEARRLDLISMLSNRTYLVIVSTPDLNSAHRIFSVMNARGLDLSPADIFKSLVIGRLNDGVTDVYAQKWEDTEQSLGRDDFADVFLHVRMIFSKVRGRRELLTEFPEQVLNDYLPDRASEFVDDVLLPYADAYQQIRDHSYQAVVGADAINRWTRRLTQLDNNDWRPPAMWAVRNHGDDPEFLDAFLSRLERLAASMLIRRAYTTPRTQRYADLLKQLDDGHGLDSEAFTLSEDERSETKDLLSGEIYPAKRVSKYVLLRLDEILAKEPGVTYNHGTVSIEHVLPQTPKTGSTWDATFDEADRLRWTHRLANLVLLNRRKNSEAQNYDFEEKKTKYFTGRNGVSTFALTSQVLGETSWTPELLEERQATLLDALTTEWDL